MTDGEKKRQSIFDKYAKNLSLAASMKIADPKFEKEAAYICPLCLNVFSSPADQDNPLTLEDAPPKSLGGKAHTLTCKTCNNTAGRKIDFHLAERLAELDNQKFLPGTEFPSSIKIDGQTFRAIISVAEDGTMSVLHSPKNNHPEKLDEVMKKLGAGSKVDMNFIKSRVIPESFEYALLKTGYMLAFKRFGYSLMLDSCYDVIRKQIADPETPIYPSGFWAYPPIGKIKPGVYFVLDKGLECLISAFNLATDLSEHTFITILPVPGIPVEETILNLSKRLETEKEIGLTLFPLEQNDEDYLEKPDQIKVMWDWLDKKRRV